MPANRRPASQCIQGTCDPSARGGAPVVTLVVALSLGPVVAPVGTPGRGLAVVVPLLLDADLLGLLAVVRRVIRV